MIELQLPLIKGRLRDRKNQIGTAISLKNHYDLFSSESNHMGVLLNA